MTALREIKLLRELEHEHIVRLLDVFPHKRNLSLVRHPCQCQRAEQRQRCQPQPVGLI